MNLQLACAGLAPSLPPFVRPSFVGSGEELMLACDCGYLARGKDSNELVSVAQAHAWSDHSISLEASLILKLATDRTRDAHREGYDTDDQATASLVTRVRDAGS